MQMLAVVYFPKTNLDKINSFRKKYDLNWQIIPPHITIVSPVPNIPEKQLIEHVESAMKNINTFSIQLTGLTKTSDGCLFLIVKEGSEKIVTLHDELYSEILNPYLPTDYPFVPHITLADFTQTDDKLFTQAYSEAQNLNFNFTCEFDALSIIKGDGLTPTSIIRTITLE